MASPFVELEIGGRTVKVTNPDKIFYRKLKATKLDHVQYYISVAEGVVRALYERPTQLKRHPDGAEGEAIYQKRVPERRPDWIETARVTFPSGRHADELCVTEIAQVAWAANLATIDFHPWPSRRAHVDNPDELRIDVDPQPGTTFKDAKKVAGLVLEVLDELGYTGWPKTSGNRGIHIACRIEPNWTFPEVRRCALAFAREVERRLPKKVTTAWWKEERGRRVFIDYNQNARDRTIASAYSVRARPDATGFGAGHLGGAPRRRDRGLHPRNDAEEVREARRRPGGDRRLGLQPAEALRVGRAGREGRGWRSALPAAVPEDGRGAEAGAAVAGESGRRRPRLAAPPKRASEALALTLDVSAGPRAWHRGSARRDGP
jgi:DNA ligase D-like protein (predicted polymerase)